MLFCHICQIVLIFKHLIMDISVPYLEYLAFAPMIGGFISTPFVGAAYRKTGKFKPWVVGILVFSVAF